MRFKQLYLLEKSGWKLKKDNGLVIYSIKNKDGQELNVVFDKLGFVTATLIDGSKKVVVHQEEWDGNKTNIDKTLKKIVGIGNKKASNKFGE